LHRFRHQHQSNRLHQFSRLVAWWMSESLPTAQGFQLTRLPARWIRSSQRDFARWPSYTTGHAVFRIRRLGLAI
jgi:hypothetical protein